MLPAEGDVIVPVEEAAGSLVVLVVVEAAAEAQGGCVLTLVLVPQKDTLRCIRLTSCVYSAQTFILSCACVAWCSPLNGHSPDRNPACPSRLSARKLRRKFVALLRSP